MKNFFLKLHILQEKIPNVFIFCLNIKFKQGVCTEGKNGFWFSLIVWYVQIHGMRRHSRMNDNKNFSFERCVYGLLTFGFSLALVCLVLRCCVMERWLDLSKLKYNPDKAETVVCVSCGECSVWLVWSRWHRLRCERGHCQSVVRTRRWAGREGLGPPAVGEAPERLSHCNPVRCWVNHDSYNWPWVLQCFKN